MKLYQIQNQYLTYYSGLFIDYDMCLKTSIATDKILTVTLIEGMRNIFKSGCHIYIIRGYKNK